MDFKVGCEVEDTHTHVVCAHHLDGSAMKEAAGCIIQGSTQVKSQAGSEGSAPNKDI